MADKMAKTEQAIYDILGDGEEHLMSELHKRCCGPSSVGVVQMHISRIRAVIRPRGEDIACITSNGTTFYQLRRLVSSGNNGRR